MRPQEDKSLRRRLVAFAVVTAAVLLLFLLRLAQFQLIDGERYYNEATAPASSQAGGGASGGPGD